VLVAGRGECFFHYLTLQDQDDDKLCLSGLAVKLSRLAFCYLFCRG
jgi:hypothetical protein